MTTTITTTIARTIARTARTALGRAARQTRFLDLDAAEAVKTAAQAAGLTGELLGWARPGLSVAGLAEAYVGRYVQAYGLGTLA